MGSERIVEKKYRVLNDSAKDNWDIVSFWTKSSSVVNNNGLTLQDTLGDVTGVATSLNDSRSGEIPDIELLRSVDNKFGDIRFGKENNKDGFYNDLGAFSPLPFVITGSAEYTTAKDSTTAIKLEFDATYLLIINSYNPKNLTVSNPGRSGILYIITTLPQNIVESINTLWKPSICTPSGSEYTDGVYAQGVAYSELIDGETVKFPGLKVGASASRVCTYSLIKIG